MSTEDDLKTFREGIVEVDKAIHEYFAETLKDRPVSGADVFGRWLLYTSVLMHTYGFSMIQFVAGIDLASRMELGGVEVSAPSGRKDN
jgi:hypothetical protein